MSIGSTGPIGSYAATAQQLSKSSDQERVAQEADSKNSQSSASAKSEADSEINENASTDDRDADGRRVWVLGDHEEGESPQQDAEEKRDGSDAKGSKDASGDRGQQLDLNG